MGIVGKVHTAKRTAPKQYPNNFGEGSPRVWRTKRMLRTVSLMFGAPTMTSSTLRGHNSVLVPLFVNTEVTSDFWYERVGLSKWQLTLGAATTNGVAMDWAVTVEMTLVDERPQIVLNTINALTRDGVLEKGKLHDSLRQVIGDAVTTGQQPDVPPALLSEIVRASYATPVYAVISTAPPQFVEDFAIRTPHSVAEVRDRLRLIRHRVIESTDDATVFEVGIVGSPCGMVAVHIQEIDEVTEIRGEITFHAAGSQVADAVAFGMCTRFANQLLSLLHLFDGEATLVQSEGSVQ